MEHSLPCIKNDPDTYKGCDESGRTVTVFITAFLGTVSDLKDVITACVDHLGITENGLPGNTMPVIDVDMPVDEILRSETFHQFPEALKAAMGRGIKIIQMSRRRMSHKNIKASVFKNPGQYLQDPFPHTSFRKHMRSVPISV